MKRGSFSAILLLSLIAFACLAFVQAQTDPNRERLPYFVVLLHRRANPPQLSKAAGEKLQKERMANILKMTADHKLAIAGSFLDDTELRDIFVFRAVSASQAQEWADSDPAVKAGSLSAEVHGPWIVDPGFSTHSPAEPPGMEQYMVVLMKRGERWKSDAPSFNLVVQQHTLFFKQMAAQGHLAVAGLFPLNIPGELRAVDIFRVGAEQTATLLKDDPAVKAGLLKAEIHPLRTDKGVLESGQPMK
jgi:uncharacterized protein YciI